MSADPKADLKRADELASRALVLDPANASAHNSQAWILNEQGRFEEAIAERERTLALDPADLNAMMSMGFDYASLG
jgi:Flp pilus assembly protein TadD